MLDPATYSVPPPRLLIAENNPALLDLLPSALSQHIPGIDMDICSSFDGAIEKLPLISHYDMVVSNVGLAEFGQFFLLRQHRTLYPLIPFLVTARAQDHEIARQAIVNGAFDIIMAPLTPHEAVSSVQLAHKFHELKIVIALRQKKLDRLHDELAKHERDSDVPLTFINQMTTTSEQKYRSRQDTLCAYEHTITALERSQMLLLNQATQLEHQVDEGALERLSILLTMARRGGLYS